MNEKKAKKGETDTEFLARLMADGFGRVDARFDAVDARFDGIDSEIVEVKDRLLSLEKIQAEILHRLDSMEKKQMGTLASLDETVHRGEFIKLAHRVEVLEKKA